MGCCGCCGLCKSPGILFDQKELDEIKKIEDETVRARALQGIHCVEWCALSALAMRCVPLCFACCCGCCGMISPRDYLEMSTNSSKNRR